MADKYRRVEKPEKVLAPNEIRVKRKVGLGIYLIRVQNLLSDIDNPTGTVVIWGIGLSIQSVVELAELVKHRVKGLHQINKISYITIEDEYEPLEEGLDHLNFTRLVTMLEITLSKNPLDKSDIGYQEPIDESEVLE